MPNDPRVKFKKKIHDLCGNHVYLTGGGSGRRGGRSIFEDGTPPDRPPGGGDPPPQTDTTTVTDFVGVPQPIKPSLNPGEITGIVVGAVAAGAALELSRRAYLEYLEEERRRRGAQPVRQTDRPIRARRGGNLLERVSRIPRNLGNVAQQFEMTSTRPTAPIQADFAAISVESSRSSSGASTPSAQSARSSAGSSSDLQSARSRPSSGTTTPAPAQVSRADPTINDPNRLTSVFTTDTGTIGVAPTQTTKPPPTRKPDTILDLQNELEMRQLELNIENARIVPDDRYFYLAEEAAPHRLPREGISEGRKNRLKSEIKALEREIEMIKLRPQAPAPAPERPTPSTAITEIDAVRAAMDIPMARPTPPTSLPEYPGFIETGSNTLSKRVAKMKSEGKSQAEIDKVIDIIQTRQTIKELNPPNLTLEKHIEMMELDIKNPSYSASKVAELQKNIDMLKTQKEVDVMDVMTNKAGKLRKKIQLAARDLEKPNVPLQDKYLRTQKTRAQNQLNKIMEEIDLKLMNPRMPRTQRQALVAEHQRAQELLTTLEPQPKLGISKTITPPSTPQRVQEGIEMRPTERKYFAEIGEIVEATMQKMGSRTPLEPSVAGRAALERARLRRVTTQLSEANSSGVGIESSGRLSNAEYRQLLEGLPEDEILEMQSLRERLNKLTSDEIPPSAPERPPVEPEERPSQPMNLERPTPQQQPEIEPTASRPQPTETSLQLEPLPPAPAKIPKLPPPVERAPVVATETHVDRFNKIYDTMIEGHRQAGFEIPEAPATMTGIEAKKHIMEEIIRETDKAGNVITEAIDTPRERALTPEESFDKIQSAYDKAIKDPITQRPVEVITQEEHIGTARVRKGPKPDQKRKLTKKGTFGATMETERLQMPSTATRPSQVRGGTSTVERATASAPETARATAPEMSARSILAPETSARVPDLRSARTMAAPEPTGPRVRAQVESINTKGRPIAPPTGEPAPSAPPSAPESEIQTPREGIITERTPAERASFAEEVRLGMNKKIPARQKAKINLGKTKATPNPLDIFVNPQYRNTPNVEIHPGAKSLSGALSELGARVPRLIPTREVLLSAGGSFAAEGGGMVAGFYAGSAAGQEMSKFFATHPPKNRGEEYGQALATSMVALGVGNLTAKVVTYVIKQGARIAMGAAVSGSVSSAGVAGTSAILEAAVFATVATTTQFYTTKALEDAGYNHSTSRGLGSAAATEALLGLEFVSFMAKGGPFNPFAIGSFVASELFILGFGIWSFFEETEAGRLEDEAEQSQREEERARIAEARVERQNAVDKINKTNYLRAGFMTAMETHDYDFDKVYATLSDADKIAMGISTPESKASFQRQVESAFDPFGAFSEPSPGIVTAPEVLSPIEQQRRDVFNSYINWYLGELRGETQPPFNYNDPKVKELDEYSGGTWKSAAGVTATTNHMQSERVNPLIVNAQNQIVDAFHNERRTIEEMDPEVVRFANLDPNFRNVYEAYIVSEAQAQILIEFNRTQYTYKDVDPKLLEIADRDPTFRATADAYYQTIANQARDLDMPIEEVVRLNSLMENEQAVEIGKLNDARNKIIEKNMASNQAAIDAYNANIIREINVYGANFEAIIRNINDQALLSGHTFLYATTKADLYRQLHMEMPELELVDPVDEIDKPDATWHPGKGRKVGDTAIYNYRYNLTDEQNQELEDMIAKGEITRADTERQAAFIRERDRPLYTETDQERADALNMSIDDYHAKFGITVDVFDMPIDENPKDFTEHPENGRIRMPDGSIKTYRNNVLIDTTAPTPIPMFNPALPQQPDGEVEMPNGAIRTYKDGLVIEVKYPPNTTKADALTPDQINERERPTTTPTEDVTFEELQILYPETYDLLRRRYGDSGLGDEKVEKALRDAWVEGYNETTGTTETGNPPGGIIPYKPPVTPTEPTRQPTYQELKLMYPDELATFQTEYLRKSSNDPFYLEAKSRQFLAQQYEQNPRPLPTTTPTQPTTPTEPLKNGDVNMPDGSTRTYKNGLIVYINYPVGSKTGGQKTLKQINEEEGVRNATYNPFASTPVTPVAPTAPLKQGLVTTPDGAKRIYKDGLVISVSYPEGKTGPTINEINTRDGVQTGTREPTYAELQIMYKTEYEYKQRNRPDSVVEAELREMYKTEPVPIPGTTPAPTPAAPAPTPASAPAPQTTASALNLAVAPSAPTPAPATTSMPEDTTPGIAT